MIYKPQVGDIVRYKTDWGRELDRAEVVDVSDKAVCFLYPWSKSKDDIDWIPYVRFRYLELVK